VKVLIATARAGGGHLAAAAALEEAWRRLYPQDRVRRLDILDYTPKLYRKAYAEGYVRLAERAPELYAHAFRKTDTPAFVRRVGTLRRLAARLVTRRFLREVERFSPDVIVAPHFLPLEAMGSLRPGARRPLLVCVITDFEAHALWMEPRVDLYCVATEATKARLIARGVPGAKVKVTGIPVSQRFAKAHSAVAARKAAGLASRRRTLLVLGGGMGMGPLEETVRQLDRAVADFQIVVVAGRNAGLKKRLRRLRLRHPAKILGFVTDMERWMAAADLIVTKPGGLTSSEALALGRPILIVNPLPGQEAANSDFLLEHGAAVKANRLEDLGFRVQRLLMKDQLARMAKAAKALGRPRAAESICHAARTPSKPGDVVALVPFGNKARRQLRPRAVYGNVARLWRRT
jgi:processive 1,2-diacylglycerol beta-glucosyltransferase